MASDRNKINYAKSALRRQYSTPPILTSGALVAGKYYQILQWGSQDSFLNVGAPRLGSGDLPGKVFIATGTTPTVWTHGTRLILIDVPGLKTYAAQILAAATDTITITSGSFEGGQGSGSITFEKVLLGIAVEELIAEFDPDYTAPAAIPRREIGTTVRLGP